MSLVAKFTFTIFTYSSIAYSFEIDCPKDAKVVGFPPPKGTLIRCILPYKGKYPGLRHGPHFSWWPNGKLKKKDYYKMDFLDGESSTYSKNGKLLYTVNYKNGKKNGFSKSFDNNGKVIEETFYRMGEIVKTKIEEEDSPTNEKKKFIPFSLKSKNDLILTCTLKFNEVESLISFHVSDFKHANQHYRSIDQHHFKKKNSLEEIVPLIYTASKWQNLLTIKELKLPLKEKEGENIKIFEKEYFKIISPGVISKLNSIENQKIKNFTIPSQIKVDQKTFKKTISKTEIIININKCEEGFNL